jgi:cytoskeleton protein RodZ
MAAERKSDFGSTLRAARERRSVSLRQVAARTKISAAVLEALERNDISRLPGGIFSRAFVRAYALEIGLDPEETLEAFIARFQQDSVTAGHAQTRPIEDHEAVESTRRTASTFLKLFAISVPIAGIVLYFSTAGRRRQPDESSTGHPTIVDQNSARVSGDSGPGAPLIVEILGHGASVVSVTIDGTARRERAITTGDRERFAAERELVVNVADAAAVSLTVNGEPARSLGTSGQPATLNLTPANYKEYVIPR